MTGHLPGSPGYRRLNGAMLLGGIGAFGMLYSTQVLLPMIGAEFDVPATATALTVSVSTAGVALTVLLAAGVAERVGRVRIMRAGLLVAVVAQLAVGLAPTFAALVAVRAVQGVALACFVGVAMGHVGREIHPVGLGRAMGLYVAGNALGGVSGRLVAAGVADLADWRVAASSFAGVALLGVIGFLVLLPPAAEVAGGGRHLGENADEGAGAQEAGVQEAGADDARRVHPAGATGWRTHEIWALATVPFVLMGALVALYNYLTYRLSEPPFSVPPLVVGLVFMAYLAGVVSSAVAGRVADAHGAPVVLAVSLTVMAAGSLLTLPDRMGFVVAGLLVLTAGFFAAHAVASGWMPVVGAQLGTRGSGLYVTAYYAGSSVIGALAGYAWIGGGWQTIVAVVLTLVALAGGCVAFVARRMARR